MLHCSAENRMHTRVCVCVSFFFFFKEYKTSQSVWECRSFRGGALSDGMVDDLSLSSSSANKPLMIIDCTGCGHCCGTNVVTVHTLWSKFQNWECRVICHSVLSKGSAEANDARLESAGREQRFQWYHETTLVVKLPNRAWKALVLSARQVVYIRLFMDAHSAIHVPLSTSTSRIWSQDWVADLDFFLFFFLNKGPVFVFSYLLWRAWFL